MILTTLAALALQGPSLVCPMMLEEVGKEGPFMDYIGVRYGICCDHCESKFRKEPAKVLSNKKLEGNLVGFSLFDPVSGARIEQKDSKAYSDYKSVRYYFATEAEKKTFDTTPAEFTAIPKKEALWCAVMGHDIEDAASSGGYVTVGDTRYYACCGDCLAKLKAQSATLTVKATEHAKEPVVVLVKPAE